MSTVRTTYDTRSMPLHTQYVFDSSIKCRKSWEESGERGRLFPPDIPPSFPQLVHEAMFCTQADDLQHNHHPPLPVPCKRKGEGEGGTYVQRNGGSRGATTYCTAAKEDSQPCFYTAPFGRWVGRHTFSSLGSSVPDSLSPPLLPPLLLIRRGRRGKGFSASLPLLFRAWHHTQPPPSFPTGLLHSTRHPSFLFPLLPSFLARRAKKGTLSCSSSGGGELPTNPLLFPKRAPSPPQQAPRNRTADGVRESCSRMYGIAAVRTVYCCCGGGQKGEGGWTKGESTLAALQCAA